MCSRPYLPTLSKFGVSGVQPAVLADAIAAVNVASPAVPDSEALTDTVQFFPAGQSFKLALLVADQPLIAVAPKAAVLVVPL